MAILSTYPDKSSLNGNERLATSDDDGSVKLAATSLLKEFTNTDPVVKSGGAYKAGLLKSDASGNVTVGKATSQNLDSASFISPDSASWKVTTLPSGKKQYRRVVVGSDVSIGGGSTGATQTVSLPTGISGTDILSGIYLITSTYTSNAVGWDRLIGTTSVSPSTISVTVYNSYPSSLSTGNQARWFFELTQM